MIITIEIVGKKVTLKTNVRGRKVEFGFKRKSSTIWAQCLDRHLDDYKNILSEDEYEALEYIDLIKLQRAFESN